MWFRNLQIYRMQRSWVIDSTQLEERLSTLTLQPCSASDAQSVGWVSPGGEGTLVHAVNRQWLLALGVEQKLLPSAVVRQFADERAKAIENLEGRRVGRKEMRELREATASELLPRAFIRRRTTFGWIDPLNGWLVVDAATPTKAEEFLGLLHKSVDGLPVRRLKLTRSPSAAMTGWVAGGQAPNGFTLDQDLELRSPENAAVRYVKHTLDGEEIRQHIAGGKAVARLALTWGERISFLLDEKLQIKRLSALDILKEEADSQVENEDERFDLDFTLMTGELARLLDDLLEALGGELEDPA